MQQSNIDSLDVLESDFLLLYKVGCYIIWTFSRLDIGSSFNMFTVIGEIKSRILVYLKVFFY